MEKLYCSRVWFASFMAVFAVIFHVQGAIVIDHNCRSLDIPEELIDSAKAKLHIAYNHTSHGSQLITGMNALRNHAAFGNRFDWDDAGNRAGALDLDDVGITDSVPDLSQGDRLDANGMTPWFNQTKAFLENPANSHVNVIMWSWCSINGHDAQRYLDNMDSLVVLFPDVKFVYMTGHAGGTGESMAVNGIHYNNELIRNHCREHDRILFDFADIEAYNPDNVYFWDKYMRDNLNYLDPSSGQARNWASEWLEGNPDNTLATLTESCYSCAHSDSPTDARLNCVLKGIASWWLFCKLAEGEPTSPVKFKKLRSQTKDYKLQIVKSSKICIENISKQNMEIKVSDIQGRNVAKITSSSESVNFSTRDLAPGLYVVQVYSRGALAGKHIVPINR